MGYRGVPTIRKKIVGKHLRQLRENSGRPMDEVAAILGISRAAAYRQETGHTVVSVSDMRTYLDLYQVTDNDYRSRLELLTRHCRRTGWWSRYNHAVGLAHVDLADAEDLATEIFYVRSSGIPALLETDLYAKAELDGARTILEAQGISVEQSLNLRTRRKEVLSRPNPPKITAVLSEGCVLAQEGGSDVLREQLNHLMELGQRPHISVQIMPFRVGYPCGYGPNLTVMKFGADMTMTIDAVGSFNDQPEVARLHLARFEENLFRALTPEESLSYLQELASRMDAHMPAPQ